MSALNETTTWEDDIYQLETTDLVQGGASGIDNLQPQQLGNRTQWLKAVIDQVITTAGLTPDALQLNQLSSALLRLTGGSGMVQIFAANTPPGGWLECDGAAISRNSYADLFTVLGTVFGVGDGATTFNLPDLRGEFIRGWDHGRGVDVGRVLGSWQKGTLIAGDDIQNGNVVSHENVAADKTILGMDGHIDQDYTGAKTIYTSSATYGRSDIIWPTHSGVSRPRNIALMFCIKY